MAANLGKEGRPLYDKQFQISDLFVFLLFLKDLTVLDWQDQDLLQELFFLKKTISQKSKLMTVRDLPLIIGLNFLSHKKITSKMINFKS